MDFDYAQLPSGYVLCPNEACPRAGQCLRQALFNGVPYCILSSFINIVKAKQDNKTIYSV